METMAIALMSLMTALVAVLLLVMGYDVFRKGKLREIRAAAVVGIVLALIGTVMLIVLIMELAYAGKGPIMGFPQVSRPSIYQEI